MNPTQLITALLLAGALTPQAGHAQINLTPPQMQNIQVAQRSGTMFVDITGKGRPATDLLWDDFVVRFF